MSALMIVALLLLAVVIGINIGVWHTSRRYQRKLKRRGRSHASVSTDC
jgi:uncharacterized protein YneF (UPF0154 family)